MGEEKIHSLYLQPKDTSSQFRAPTVRHSYIATCHVTRTSLLVTRTSLVHRYLSLVHRYLSLVHRYLSLVHRYLQSWLAYKTQHTPVAQL